MNKDEMIDDEVVIKKSEYEKLRLAQYNAQTTINENFLLALEKIEQAKQETARKILQDIYDYCKEDEYGQVVVDFSCLESLANQYGIELE